MSEINVLLCESKIARAFFPICVAQRCPPVTTTLYSYALNFCLNIDLDCSLTAQWNNARAVAID